MSAGSTRISSKEKMHKLVLALALGAAATVDVTADVKAWHAAVHAIHNILLSNCN